MFSSSFLLQCVKMSIYGGGVKATFKVNLSQSLAAHMFIYVLRLTNATTRDKKKATMIESDIERIENFVGKGEKH